MSLCNVFVPTWGWFEIALMCSGPLAHHVECDAEAVSYKSRAEKEVKVLGIGSLRENTSRSIAPGYA